MTAATVEAPPGLPAGYRLVRAVSWARLWLFYCRVDVVGRERIPAQGGVVVAANHHNSVVDAMLIVAVFPRPVMVLANAPRQPVLLPLRTGAARMVLLAASAPGEEQALSWQQRVMNGARDLAGREPQRVAELRAMADVAG